MVHWHKPHWLKEKEIKKSWHYVESKIVRPVYKDVIKPTLLLPEKVLDVTQNVATSPNMLIFGGVAVALAFLITRK